MAAKNLYRNLCVNEESIPIFSQAWWLDAVAPDSWDVVLVQRGKEIIGSLPYVVKKRFGLTLLTHPPLTQNLGPWLKPANIRYSKKLALEKDVLQELYRQLPTHSYYKQNWHYSRSNWLPLYWLGYEQTTRYTYVIKDIGNIDAVIGDFEHSKRKNIKKCESLVNVVFDISAEDFYNNHMMTLAKQGQNISYKFDVFKRVHDSGYANNSARTIAAYDRDGNLHAALFVVWDKTSAYDLISTIDPDFRTYGAASLLVQEIIKYVAQFVKKFDFEGSMIEPVERSFRQFGAIQTPYFSISKSNSKILQAVDFFRSLKARR